MQSKNYADSDFFLALMKDSDWLKQEAILIYEKYKENIWVTPFTIVEIMIVCQREKIPLKETLIQISRIAKLETMQWQVFFKASELIEKGATLFDSLLMSHCGNEEKIISSDKIYNKFGFKVIDLKR